MDIYVVQPNDTIENIAKMYNLSAEKLIRDNELENPEHLVPGQTIVITYPAQTYIVQEGDTLLSISVSLQVPVMQLLRNNPFLCNRKLYPGEIIIIRYDTIGEMITNGFAYSYLDIKLLKKTLPNLTYLTVYNYKPNQNGELLSYFDDSQIIQTAKKYGTAPLMMLTSYSLQGKPDPETAETILSNYNAQQTFIDNMIQVITNKGYSGINFYFDYLTQNNLKQHEIFAANIKRRFEKEGYLFFTTINPNITEEIDYSLMGHYTDNITFMQFVWGINYEPPHPVNSIAKIEYFTKKIIQTIPPNKITAGYSLISYDWPLPYVPGVTYANSLSIHSALDLAYNTNSIIQFDDVSQSPFFTYKAYNELFEGKNIVWSIDARSIFALTKLITDLQLSGSSFWNIMIYNSQFWLVINSQYVIQKFLPPNLESIIIS